MSLDKLIPQKINVRSPFFITVTSEGAPDLSVDCPVDVSDTPVNIPSPTNDPTPQPEYVQPDQLTEYVYCGDTVNIGEDVGVKTYVLEVGKVTGNVTIDYRVNIPVTIVAFWNAPIPGLQNTGYVGNSDFEQDLIDAGIGNTSNLASGEQTGTITINKTAETPETVEIVVGAPIPTDDYSLTFNCPAAPAIVPDPAPPVSQVLPASGGGELIENIPMFGLGEKLNNNAKIKLTVNGNTVAENMSTNKLYYFSDYDPVSDLGITDDTDDMVRVVGNTAYTSAQRFDKSTYFRDGVNEIIWHLDDLYVPSNSRSRPDLGRSQGSVIGAFRWFRGGVFYASGQWHYAKPNTKHQIGNKVGWYSRGVNTVTYGERDIDTYYRATSYYNKPPLKIIFYYDTGNTFSGDNPLIQKRESLITPDQYSGLLIHGASSGTSNILNPSGIELADGDYFKQYSTGIVHRYNVYPIAQVIQ